jgi:hypothetical protein
MTAPFQDDAEQRHAKSDGNADHADGGDGCGDRQPLCRCAVLCRPHEIERFHVAARR